MSDFLPPEEIRDVVRPALIRHGMMWNAIVRDDRHRPNVEARRDVYRALRDHGLSLPEIAAYVQRHHTTVMHHLKATEPEAQHDEVEVLIMYPDGSREQMVFEGDVFISSGPLNTGRLSVTADTRSKHQKFSKKVLKV